MDNYYPWKSSPFLTKTVNSDITTLDIPAKKAVNELIRSGQSPLWLPYSLAGRPLLANPQTQVLYPLSFLTFISRNFLKTYTYITVLHLLLGGLFMFIYSRYLKLSFYGAFISSVIFVFNPLILQSAGLQHDVSTYTLTPLFFLITEISIQRKNPLFLIFLASITGLAILAGHLQGLFFIIIINFIYFYIRLLASTKNKKRVVRFTLFFLGSFFLGMGIGSIQLIPALELASLSFRKDFLVSPSLSLSSIQDLFFPRIFKEPGLPYSGIISFPLLVVGVFFHKSKITKQISLLVLLLILFLLISPFLYPLLQTIPGINQSRSLARFLLLYVFFASYLIGRGFDLTLNSKTKEKLAIIRKITQLNYFLIIILFSSLFLLSVIPKINPIPTFSGWRNALGTNPTRFLVPLSLLILFRLTLISFKSEWITKKILFITIIIILLFDLFPLGWSFLKTAKVSEVFPKTPAIKLLKMDTSVYRILSLRDVFPFEFSSYFSLQSLNTYTGVYPEKPRVLITSSSNVNHLPDNSQTYNVGNFTYFEPKIRNLFNIKYVLASPSSELKDNALDLIYDGEIKIYKNRGVLPRAFTIREIIFVKDEEEALEKIFSPEFNPKTTALLLEKNKEHFADFLFEENNNQDQIQITSYSSGLIKIKTQTVTDSLLILTENNYPGWEATIDGKKTEIYKTNYAFQSIKLPKGTHQIIFTYNPDSFRIGIWISTISSIIFLLILIKKREQLKIYKR